MSLRERKDCTEEALVPRASAIQSSVLPASTHSLICSMWGFKAMRFLESAMLPPAPSYLSTISQVCDAKWSIHELPSMLVGILTPRRQAQEPSSRSEVPDAPPLPASGASGSFLPPDSCSTP